MTANELVALGAKTIRNNEEYMRLYIEFYEGAFSLTPNCAPCTFNNDFAKLKKYLSTGAKATKPQTMENRTHVLNRKHRNVIFTYKENGRPFRSYGYLMTDEFAEKFINSAGTKKEKEARKALFDVLPGKSKRNDKEKEATNDVDTQGTASTEQNPETDKSIHNIEVDAETVDGSKEVPGKTPKYTEDALKPLRRPEVDELLVKEGLKPEDFSRMGDAKIALAKL